MFLLVKIQFNFHLKYVFNTVFRCIREIDDRFTNRTELFSFHSIISKNSKRWECFSTSILLMEKWIFDLPTNTNQGTKFNNNLILLIDSRRTWNVVMSYIRIWKQYNYNLFAFFGNKCILLTTMMMMIWISFCDLHSTNYNEMGY